MENLLIVLFLAVCIFTGAISMLKHFTKKSGCCGSGTFRENKKLARVVGKKLVRIEGMMCENCEARVERYINEIPGAAARASHKKNQAVVSYEKEIGDEQIRAAVEKAGYKVL